jgi:ABC-2 type transport system ATP-binding protein
MDSAPVISLQKLSKRYRANLPFALKDVSLDIMRGEVYGFLGPNGAGKSTTIRTLLNFIYPSAGTAKIMGLDIVRDSVKIRRNLGYLSGDFRAYDKMTGQQFLNYMQALQPAKHKNYSKELASTFQINLKKRINTLSKGNRQKIGIIQAFMHEPEVIILDEPTDGLDPLMQEAFYDLVRTSAAAGTTIFMSSHNLSEVKKVCDRVGIIKDGVLVDQKTIADLAEAAAQTFIVSFKDKAPLGELRAIKSLKVVPQKDGSVQIHTSASLTPVFKVLAKHEVLHLSTREFNLEDEFMHFYEKKGRS